MPVPLLTVTLAVDQKINDLLLNGFEFWIE